MKKLFGILSVIILILGIIIFYPREDTKYLRVHIKANSNLSCDQSIKYEVKDLVCDYLTPLFLDCQDIENAKNILDKNLSNIELILNSFLKTKGFTYSAIAKLNNEFFPTRVYDELILNDGYYDALIIYLGEGAGDNWWCVLYPPMCLQKNTKNIEYKSRLLKIIKQII